MSRPKKRTALYFPHFVASPEAVDILCARYQGDGYVFWYRLLEKLCASDGQALDLNDKTALYGLAASAYAEPEDILEMIGLLADLGTVDRELWEARRIVWVQWLADNLAEMYSKRKDGAPRKPTISGVSGAETHENEVSGPDIMDSRCRDSDIDPMSNGETDPETGVIAPIPGRKPGKNDVSDPETHHKKNKSISPDGDIHSDADATRRVSVASEVRGMAKTFADGDAAMHAALTGWIEMRTRMKKPLTARAMKLALGELEALARDGPTQIKIIDQSTLKSWLSFFPLDNGGDKRNATTHPKPRAQDALGMRTHADWMGNAESG